MWETRDTLWSSLTLSHELLMNVRALGHFRGSFSFITHVCGYVLFSLGREHRVHLESQWDLKWISRSLKVNSLCRVKRVFYDVHPPSHN